MTLFNRTRVSLCTALTAALIATAARPAGAQPLSTRLDQRSLASGTPREREFYQWPTASKTGARKSGDLVVDDSNKRGPLSLIVIGGGVVAVGVGAFFGMRNRSAMSDYRSAQTAAARTDAHDRAQSAGTKANIAFVASGVLLVTGLGMLFLTDL